MKQLSLNRLLWIDGLAALTAGLFILALRQFLSGLLGFPLWLLVLQGCINLCYAAYSLPLARRKHRPRWMLWVLAVGNMAYALFALVLLCTFFPVCTAWGVVFFVAEILFIGGLGALEALLVKKLSS